MPLKGLIDSTVLIDKLRLYQPAKDWFNNQDDLGISNVFWMELIAGARDKSAQRESLKLVSTFEIVYFTENDMEWAMRALLSYRLTYSVGVGDCLIASVSHRLQIPLYTHNLKHFTPILGSLALRPY